MKILLEMSLIFNTSIDQHLNAQTEKFLLSPFYKYASKNKAYIGFFKTISILISAYCLLWTRQRNAVLFSVFCNARTYPEKKNKQQ